jgi:hypothetical protein
MQPCACRLHLVSLSHISAASLDIKKFHRNATPKIQAENCCGNLLRKISAENLGGHAEFMRLVKIKACDRTMADAKISAAGKISAPLKFTRLVKFLPL